MTADRPTVKFHKWFAQILWQLTGNLQGCTARLITPIL